MTHGTKDTDENTSSAGGRTDVPAANLERRERLARGGSIYFDAGCGRSGEVEVISDCECTVCLVKQPKLLWMDGSEGEYSGGTVCLDCLRAFLAGPEACDHDWKDARNEVVTSGEICSKCNSTRAGNTQEKNP